MVCEIGNLIQPAPSRVR